ncbi:acyltransferase family protein [Roseibacillus persicicus]|uniref:acyltransferase family protein n=1 Tax=Roseibacillus persicicus TaxID=454148 RepID=UPI00280E1D29|nr:acyltransferase [Roseibacillus persicicus]MDQ8188854.1 acyltransferase [Roseibacillus persicicus]
MSPEVSSRLNSLRAIAALVVFLGHFYSVVFPFKYFYPFSLVNHEAVVVFFVLSGYVIAFAVRTKKRSLVEYLSSRISRIYIVIVPVLLLTLVADSIGGLLLDGHRGLPSPTSSIKKVILCMFSLQESWQSTQIFSNSPLWSISYEFQYYVIFGLFTYLSGWRRWIGVFVASMIAGPQILLLLPCWLTGVLVFHIHSLHINVGDRKRISRYWLGFSGLLLLVTIFLKGAFLNPNPLRIEGLSYSGQFLSDYCISMFVGLFVYSFTAGYFPGEGLFHKLLLPLCAVSFSLYAVHLPLFELARGLGVDSGLGVLLALSIVSVITVGFYMLFERRHRSLNTFLLSLTKKYN